MGLIKKPSELQTLPTKKVLLYGQPGAGKSTLALSSPNPVLLDFDGGAHRINGAHQCPTLPVTKWEEVIEVMKSGELNEFASIVIDTAGKMLDYMSAYIIKNDPRMAMRDGSLSLKGYGVRKTMFINFLNQCQQMRKHLIFVAHEREDKDGEKRFIRPEIGGSSQADLIKELDLVGYVRSNVYQREVCWTGTDQFYGKNACQLQPVMPVPCIIDAKTLMPTADNDFLTRVFAAYDNYLVGQHNLRAKYDHLMQRVNDAIAKINDAEAANTFWGQLQTVEHIWASKAQAKAFLDAKCASLGLKFNDMENKYEAA